MYSKFIFRSLPLLFQRHRKVDLAELFSLFVQILEICREAGQLKAGYGALDGTKLKADASKHKAVSYNCMVKPEPELAAEGERLVAETEAVDEREDKKDCKGPRSLSRHWPDLRGPVQVLSRYRGKI